MVLQGLFKWPSMMPRLNPSDVQYINAHGTSTPVGDDLESKAISSVFGASASKVWSQQHKSMMGHALGAASAMSPLSALWL